MRKTFLMWSPPVSQFPIGETSATMMERSKSAHLPVARFVDVWCFVGLGLSEGDAGDLPLISSGGDGDLYPCVALSNSSSLPDTSTSLPLSSSESGCRTKATDPRGGVDLAAQREGPACAALLDMFATGRRRDKEETWLDERDVEIKVVERRLCSTPKQSSGCRPVCCY